MGYLTSGEYFDGTPVDYINYKTPIGMAAVLVTALYLFATMVMFVLLVRGWLGITKSKVFYFVWTCNIIQFIYYIVMVLRFSSFSFPLLCWGFSVLGTVTLYVVIMGQLEILKVFTINSNILNRKVVYYGQIGFTVFSLGCLGGLYLTVFYIGYPRPEILDKWHFAGYLVFALTCLLYETFHAIYVSRSVVDQVQKRRQLVISSLSKKNEEAVFRELYYLVIVCIIVDWTAAIIWTNAWFLPKSNEATALGMIGNTVGVGHILFMTAIFKKLKLVNVKRIRGSKFESSIAQTTVSIFKSETEKATQL
ncbi:hypothetical protein HDV01_005774 [Terramyces sp. JEL0728]|nr:hypothetical protein HDV01_005774 [Terramyces sp. JEL0728]